MPAINAALEDRGWKVKEFVLMTLTSLSKVKTLKKAVAECLPSMCPVRMRLLVTIQNVKL